jgi:membrane protein insertase Oxa1/YidC/SpoIIIJ
LPAVDQSILYDFVKVPEKISMSFLGIFDLNSKSIFLAFVAALTQFMHLSVSMPDVKFSDLKKKPESGLKEDMMNSFQVNLKYGLPVLIFFMLVTAFNSAVAIYWITSNIFMTGQEFLVRNKKKELKN